MYHANGKMLIIGESVHRKGWGREELIYGTLHNSSVKLKLL